MSYTASTEALIQALQALPGVGTRSAARMALQLLERDTGSAIILHQCLGAAIEKVHKCPTCRCLTESTECDLCTDDYRVKETLCVVASDSDRNGIEMSGHYQGQYYVLHGVLSPIDGVGPEELGILELKNRILKSDLTEVILALDEQMEAEATAHFISELLKEFQGSISRIRFTQMRSGALDKTESHVIGNAIAAKEDIGFEYD